MGSIPRIFLEGQIFSRLTVLEEAEPHYYNGKKKRRWLCICECGTKTIVRQSNLQHSQTRSCGCLPRDRASEVNSTHRSCELKAYSVWTNMKDRCCREKNPAYKDYGGRGITVCDSWLKFENFLADMGDRPEGKTLDRIDNNLGYSPENCQWKDWFSQANNRRSNRRHSFNGDLLTIREIANLTGVPDKLIRRRIDLGWDIKTAVHTPKMRNRHDAKFSE